MEIKKTVIKDILKRVQYRKDNNFTLILDTERNRFFIFKGFLLYFLLNEYGDKNNKEGSLDKIVTSIMRKYKLPFSYKDKIKKKSKKLLLDLIAVYKNKKEYIQSYIPSKSLSMPLYLEIILTYRCNLKCKHCLCYYQKNNFPEEITLVEIEKIAEEMKNEGVFRINLNGGEPTVRKDFFDILEIFHRRKILIGVSTNSLIFSKKEMADKISKFSTLNFNISLEGHTPLLNDIIRGEGSYKKIVEGIKNLVNVGFKDKIVIKVTYNKYNYNQIEEIVNFIEDLGISNIVFTRLKPWGKGIEIKNLLPSYKEVRYVNEKINELKRKKKYMKLIGDTGRVTPNKNCAALFQMTILPDGSVVPCILAEQVFSDLVLLGNIKKNTLKEIWESKKSREMRKKILKFSNEVKRSRCKDCSLSKFCLANQCLIYNYILFNKLEMISNPCVEYKRNGFF